MTDLQGFQTTIEKANSLLVCLPINPTQDAVAAALALYLSFQLSGKSVSIVSSSPPVVRDSRLVGLDKIGTSLGGNNLVITIGGPEDAVDKVTSNTERGHLNLIITAKKGLEQIKQSDLTFSYSGATADAILVVGAKNLADLGPFAEKEAEFIAKTPLINFGPQTSTFGTIDFTDPSSSNSELATAAIQELKLPLNADIAGNLLQGIEAATSGLSSPDMTADTFEALAVLYRAGARRSRPNSFPTATIVANTPILDSPPSKPSAVSSSPPPRPAPVIDSSVADSEESSRPDWLQPKIFKGSSHTN